MNTIDAYTRDSPANKVEECARLVVLDTQKRFVLSRIMTPGQKYTFSFWITTDADSTISVLGSTFEVYTDWRKYQLTFKAASENLQLSFDPAGTFYIYHPKLEIGNQATDWTLAPEDSESFATIDALGELEQGMQTIRENVSQLSVEADGIRTSVLNAQQLIDAASGEIKQVDARVTKVEQSATDISISVQSIQENGVSKVNTTTGFTFDEEGMSVDKTDSLTKTTVTPDGMKVYSKTSGASEVLSATSSGVDATNLHAKTYLIIGGRSRFENYGNDRTGCFWIGD